MKELCYYTQNTESILLSLATHFFIRIELCLSLLDPSVTRQSRREGPAHCASQPESAILCRMCFLCCVRLQKWQVLATYRATERHSTVLILLRKLPTCTDLRLLQVRECPPFTLLRLDSPVAARWALMWPCSPLAPHKVSQNDREPQ